MDQAELFGRVLKVNQAKPQQKAGEGLGSRTAVWEQVSFFGLHIFNAGSSADSEISSSQEGYASRHGLADAVGMDVDGDGSREQGGMDPMQGLEGLDQAGPKLQ